jgi:CheY-like chemotaxis protein
MAAIGMLCSDAALRERLALLAGECGHLVRPAADLSGALELLREGKPRLMLLFDEPGHDALVALREVLRAAPLLPVVAVLSRRDAGRAVALMRAGAAEVLAPPWTKEALRSCLSKALRLQGTSYAVARPPRWGAFPYFVLACSLFFAVSLAQSARLRRAAARAELAAAKTHWDLPFKHPASLAWDGKAIWTVDWFSQSLYVHDERAEVRRLHHFTADMPVGVAFGGGSGWTAMASGHVVRHMLDGKWTALERVPASATGGMAFDGLYLWTADAKARRIHKRILDSKLTIVGTFRYPGAEPAGLAWDGRALWSLDGPNRQLIRHNLERPDEGLDKRPLREYGDGAYRPAGLAWDGKRFWTIGEKRPPNTGAARLFKHAFRP